MASLKIVRWSMESVGPAPKGSRRESTQDVSLIKALLISKAHEEAEEHANAQTPEDQLAELGDMLKVVRALAELHGWTLKGVIEAADMKRVGRGGLVQPIAGAPGRFTADLLRRSM